MIDMLLDHCGRFHKLLPNFNHCALNSNYRFNQNKPSAVLGITHVVCNDRIFDNRLSMYVQQTIFEITPVEVCSPSLCASFGTFCDQIGQLFKVQRVFEVYLKIDK